MKKIDYNSIAFKNSDIDKISSCCGGNGGSNPTPLHDPSTEVKVSKDKSTLGKTLPPSHVKSLTTDSYSKTEKHKSSGKSKSRERAKTKSQLAVTELDSGKVYYEEYQSKRTRRGRQKEKEVSYTLPSQGQGYKIVTKPSGKRREKTLSEKRTERLRNKFYMGRTINP